MARPGAPERLEPLELGAYPFGLVKALKDRYKAALAGHPSSLGKPSKSKRRENRYIDVQMADGDKWHKRILKYAKRMRRNQEALALDDIYLGVTGTRQPRWATRIEIAYALTQLCTDKRLILYNGWRKESIPGQMGLDRLHLGGGEVWVFRKKQMAPVVCYRYAPEPRGDIRSWQRVRSRTIETKGVLGWAGERLRLKARQVRKRQRADRKPTKIAI